MSAATMFMVVVALSGDPHGKSYSDFVTEYLN